MINLNGYWDIWPLENEACDKELHPALRGLVILPILME